MTDREGPPISAPTAPSALRRALPWLAAAGSGVLTTLCFAPWNQEWLCWLALTPLLAAVWTDRDVRDVLPPVTGDGKWPRIKRWVRRPAVRAFLMGYVAGLIFIWGAFYWLTQVTKPGWFILPFYMGLYFAGWAWFMGTVAKPWKGAPLTKGGREGVSAARLLFQPPDPASSSPLLRSRWNLWFAFLGACCWVGLEWMRGWVFSGFGWNNLGVALHADLPFVQLAEWTGTGGPSFLAAFVNVIAVATVLRFALEVRSHRVRPHFDFTLTIAGMLLVFSLGIRAVRSSVRDAERPGAMTSLRVAAVQAGIAQSEKWDPSMETGILKIYRELSETAIATRPELLLWPEAATPYGVFDARGETYKFVTGIAQEAGCNLLFGTLDYDFGADNKSDASYNAAMMVAAGADFSKGVHLQIYRKIHLVPYGEYIPFRHSFPLFAWVVGDQVPSDFTKGTEPGVFQMANPEVKVGPLICFEDTLGRVAREPVLRGAQLFVNLTNDAWFGLTAASQQQLADAVFRTVENRRPMVRCANTGVTAFIDRTGRITQVLKTPEGSIFERGILAGEVQVPTDPTLTFYTRHGEIFSVACLLAAGMIAFLGAWRHLRRMELRRRSKQPGHGSGEERADRKLRSVP